MPTALLSVSDKTGVVELARALVELGWELISTGGTAQTLRDAALPVQDVSSLTGHPEMMDGRIKTLHPAVHAGILARREHGEDMEALRAHSYRPIDMVIVNLYPFHEAAAAHLPLPAAMEQVDVGGPTMLRAAAKNYEGVLVVVDPHDYARVLDALRQDLAHADLRCELAAKVFRHTAAYDAAIADYFARTTQPAPAPAPDLLPNRIRLDLDIVQALRYGENPDQPAAFYAETGAPPDSLPFLRQLHGKELSFNNLLDVDAAITAAAAWADDQVVCIIIKHTTPCGVALADDASSAYRRASEGDPVSAFGGIVAFNTTVTRAAADALSEAFLEIVVAPAFDDDALETLRRKKNLRLITLPTRAAGVDELDYKRVRGGFLVQRRMRMSFPEDGWRVVSQRAPQPHELDDLRFAWRVAANVKSNAIVLARDARTLGIGAGQMSRVDAARIAVMKAHDRNIDLSGACLASDAFFPFRDGVDAAANHGIATVIQPGGSVRDAEVIEAADHHGIAMVFTGRRVFRH
jgi:phosphoribosylaminoimidazolecarboxamide formyltransferase/IMP cyclohydrolase